MTVVIHDATQELHHSPSGNLPKLDVNELIYADDTLVVGVDSSRVQTFMHYIQRAGANFGLQFNWRKPEVLSVRCDTAVPKPDATHIEQKDSIVYLGGLLPSSGEF